MTSALTAGLPASSLTRRVLLLAAGLGAATIGIVALGPVVGHAIALGGHTDSREIKEIVIGNEVLHVPANAIRRPGAREDGVVERLDLYWRWPELDGWSEAARAEFNNAGDRPSILFLSIERRTMSRDMSGRLEPVYGPMLEPGERAGPAGLTLRDLRADSGYTDEVLAVGGRSEAPPFVARCLKGEAAANSLAPCERDVVIGEELTLTYRFPQHLLDDWQALDERVRAAATKMVVRREG